ncbi:hypothetical protein Tco_0462972 [Tanacetum coccineum]
MLVIKRFSEKKKIFRERKKTEKIRAKSEGEVFLEGGDFNVSVVRLQTCLTDILGFLEKFKGGFEQDIDDKGEEDKEDEEDDGELLGYMWRRQGRTMSLAVIAPDRTVAHWLHRLIMLTWVVPDAVREEIGAYDLEDRRRATILMGRLDGGVLGISKNRGRVGGRVLWEGGVGWVVGGVTLGGGGCEGLVWAIRRDGGFEANVGCGRLGEVGGWLCGGKIVSRSIGGRGDSCDVVRERTGEWEITFGYVAVWTTVVTVLIWEVRRWMHLARGEESIGVVLEGG